MESYQHKPLDDSSREIRLVNLQPGLEPDPIHVTLSHALLDGNVAYDALSYAWGDPNITLPITIDGLPFQVTVNLESGLRHLRLPTEPRTIWIDAICIHQTNLEERGHQVRRMGSVYANARNVLVWLGPATDDSDLAMEIIDRGIWDRIVRVERLEEPRVPFLEEFGSVRRLKAITKFFARAWWRRGWIIQEVRERGKPRENVLVHCGHLQKPWKDIVSAMSSLSNYGWLIKQERVERPAMELLNYLSCPLFLTRGLSHEAGSFESWLAKLRSFETTEPKDKFWIACLLSRDSPSFSYLEPKYQWSWRETFIFIVRYLLKCWEDLTVLEYCSETVSDLPSWVPDWRSTGPDPRSHWQFRACRNSEIFFEIIDDSSLHVKGFHLDSIKKFSVFPNYLKPLCSELKQEAAAIGSTYEITGESSKKALIRVAFADPAVDIQEAW